MEPPFPNADTGRSAGPTARVPFTGRPDGPGAPLPPPNLPGAPGLLVAERPITPPPAGRPPSGGRRTLLAIGGIVASLAIVEGALTLLGLMLHTTASGTQSLTGITHTLAVTSDSGDVHLVSSADGQPHVTWKSHYSIRRPHVTVRQEGDRVILTSGCGVWLGVIPGMCSTAIEVALPADTAVTVDSSAGDVSAVGLTGALRLSSGAGDVLVDDVSGTITARSSAGDVLGRRVRSARVDARSDAGDVRLTFAAEPDVVRAESSAGDVVVTLPAGERLYAVEAGTSAGSTYKSVRTSSESPYVVTAHSSAGDVTVRYAN